MTETAYLDFDLLIEHLGEGYNARVLNSPAGEAANAFASPLTESEMKDFGLRLGRTPSHAERDAQRDWPSKVTTKTARVIGHRLFGTVFDGEVRGCLCISLDAASREGTGLRIRLRLSDVPELAGLPWEYLYDSALNRFMALSSQTPIVRYLDLPERIQPLAVEPPLRALVMVSSPRDYPRLDVDREWVTLRRALIDLEGQKRITLERLEEATLDALQQRLRRDKYHIFHFIGHGDYNEEDQEGVLLLEDDEEYGQPVSSYHLGMLLHDHQPLRLAILNSCKGAQASRRDAFAGTAQNLVRQGIPAVIAMQSGITDQAAITFAHEFYNAIADSYPVDAALAEARKAMARGQGVEWGTPVLFMRTSDGRIFNVEGVSEADTDMDAQALAAMVVSYLAPYLGEAGEKVAAETGEAAWNKMQVLYAAVKNELQGDPYADQTLHRLQDVPESRHRRAALEGILEERLGYHHAFARMLQDLLREAEEAGGDTINQQVTVSDQAQTGNITQIGRIEGNLDWRGEGETDGS